MRCSSRPVLNTGDRLACLLMQTSPKLASIFVVFGKVNPAGKAFGPCTVLKTIPSRYLPCITTQYEPFISHNGCFPLRQFCNDSTAFTFILFASQGPIIFSQNNRFKCFNNSLSHNCILAPLRNKDHGVLIFFYLFEITQWGF